MSDFYEELESIVLKAKSSRDCDLQIAAELGNKLLLQNEDFRKELQSAYKELDEKNKQIEHLQKQTAALRSTNDNRIRLSEHLEVSVADLERANQRLALDNAAKNKEIKGLKTLLDSHEQKLEELQNALEDAQKQIRHSEKTSNANVEISSPREFAKDTLTLIEDLQSRNRHILDQRAKDQRKIVELEAEILRKEQELNMREEEIMSLQLKERDLLSVQEQFRSEADKLCRRCLSISDENLPHRIDMQLDPLEGNIMPENQYTPFETLMGELRPNCLSLQEELKMSGDFQKEQQPRFVPRRGKATPTDLSEVETLSSGFPDETSSKATQTDLSGPVLLSISDGEEGTLSIYNSTLENRFKSTSGIRTLFEEINACLRRAAKKEDLEPSGESRSVIVTQNDLPIDPEDLISLPGSVIESVCDSITESIASETSSIADFDRIAEEPLVEALQTPVQNSTNDILEYATIMARQKKKKTPRKRQDSNTPTQRRCRYQSDPFEIKFEKTEEPSPSRKRQWRNHGKIMTTLEKTEASPSSPKPVYISQLFVSTASQEVARLKKLEKSYAEVLRTPPQRTVYYSKLCRQMNHS